MQAQLSLGGGLGLRSLALHSPAAYLASLSKAGLLTSSDEEASEYLNMFKSQHMHFLKILYLIPT